MNISFPVSSALSAVDFGFYTSEEIKKTSVKQINNPDAFNSLMHPSPGGLYDPALGCFHDNPCTTCCQTAFHCPGHCGHIELPVPVYHISLFDQLLKILNAKCRFCHHLRFDRRRLDLYACKLRLLRYGLLDAFPDLEYIGVVVDTKKAGAEDVDAEESTDEDEANDEIIQKRDEFVKTAIKNAIVAAGGKDKVWMVSRAKIGAVTRARKTLIRELLSEWSSSRICSLCKHVSPKYRKNGTNKIFEKALTLKEKTKNSQLGRTMEDPLLLQMAAKKAAIPVKPTHMLDEGVADVGEEEVDLDVEMIELTAEAGGLVDDAAGVRVAASQKETKNADKYMNPSEIRAALALLFEKDGDILNLLYDSRAGAKNRPMMEESIFFITHIMVPPNKLRPPTKSNSGAVVEAEQNTLYRNVLKQVELMASIQKELQGAQPVEGRRRPQSFVDFQNSWITLQDHVNGLIDNEHGALKQRGNVEPPRGIKQVMEKKEGLFRMNMMGKRVNFAARSVISPDPNIETNEIGVPLVFAKKLTYPEPVGEHNYLEMQNLVYAGPDAWPGATAVEDENGHVVNLKFKSANERQTIGQRLMEKADILRNPPRNKKVHRYLQSGDVVIMNRQPTLHKPSMMAHIARVLPAEKTIRMHYANCNTYNADFDGDEMNMHFPQNELCRAEAYQIADTNHQYLVATSGKPLRGLIQDHLSISVWLCSKDIFFSRSEYQELLYSCLRPEDSHIIGTKLETVPPAIIRPRLMWTGKQVITTVLKNVCPQLSQNQRTIIPGITLSAKSKLPGDRWQGQGQDQQGPLKDAHSEEGRVLFHQGDFLHGILDKDQLGPAPGGIIHSIYELHGPNTTGSLLSVIGRLLTRLLSMRAFSCGIEDISMTEGGETLRHEKLKDAEVVGLEVAAKYVSIDGKARATDPQLLNRLEAVFRDDKKLAGLDAVVTKSAATLSSDVTKALLPGGLHIDFPKNQMQAMTASGAKGSLVNANQISCNLGQQVLEGRRVPTMASGKSLPSFQAYETKIRAGGYVIDRFFSGVKPQEYCFHAMAGREGLVDTAVKTARSGYLQRCLVKGMEGLTVQYDTSVRDCDGSLVQFLYGEDGLEVTKQTRLDDFAFMAENSQAIIAQVWPDEKDKDKVIKPSEVGEYRKKTVKKFRKTDEPGINDPVLALFDPASNLGSTSDKFTMALNEYVTSNPQGALRNKKAILPVDQADNRLNEKAFKRLLDLKYMEAVIDAGEAVGIVAGQSIGEPSTQMTLNTFHLAGHAAKNVTLGIPRLREIVMTASAKISTPTMTMYLRKGAGDDEGKNFAQGLTRLSLNDVVEKVTINEKIGEGHSYAEAKLYEVHIHLFPAEEYTSFYNIKTVDVLKAIEQDFVPVLIKSVEREMKVQGDPKLLKGSNAAPEIGSKAKAVRSEQATGKSSTNDDEPPDEGSGPKEGNDDRDGGDDDSEASEEDSDDDADENHQKRAKAHTSYEDLDEEEKELSKEARAPSEEPEDADLPEDEGYAASPRSNADSDDEAKGTFDRAAKEASRSTKERIMNKWREVSKFHFGNQFDHCTITLEYDVGTPQIILLDLVEAAVRRATIQHIKGIGSATLTKELQRDPVTGKERKVPVVLTEGVNIAAMHDYQNVINPHKLFTNDIHSMMRVYGIEAALATIMQEMNAVFSSHGITVDHRHLNLIAAFMTRSGEYLPFNRQGMRDSVSPFHKMSFETTVAFLKDALLEGDYDDLRNPSASLVTGRLPSVGTGVFDVFLPAEFSDEPIPPQNISKQWLEGQRMEEEE